MTLVTIKYANGKTLETEVWCEYADGGYLVAKIGKTGNTVYYADADGTVEKQKMGTGHNAGVMFGDAEKVNATWEKKGEE